jgi:hypothetical protein
VTTSIIDLSARAARARAGDSLAHLALANAYALPITGIALCGYRVSGTATPLGTRQLCVVCEDLARGDWHEPSRPFEGMAWLRRPPLQGGLFIMNASRPGDCAISGFLSLVHRKSRARRAPA